MQETHVYEPLRSRSHIRLLKVKSPKPKHRTCFAFKLVQLDPWGFFVPRSRSKYECVSYCWAGTGADTAKKLPLEAITGSSETGWLLNLAGKQGSIKITESLVEALPYLCRETKTGYLWIDQLCINQHDSQERSTQVSRMGRIYSRAERTVTWLGSLPAWADRDLQAYERSDALMDIIFSRNWFDRGWVVQEFVLAEKADFLFETACYESHHLWFNACTVNFLRISPGDLDVSTWRGAAAFLFMGTLQSNVSLSVQSITDSNDLLQEQLRLLWVCAGTFKTTEPQDRIFAYLGLLSQITYLPNYNLETREMLIDLTVNVIRQSQRLDILAYARRKEGSDPSWVPTWRHELTEKPRSFIPTDYTETVYLWAPFGSTSLQWQAWPRGLFPYPPKLPYDVLSAERLRVRGRSMGEARCMAGPVNERWTTVLKDALDGAKSPEAQSVLNSDDLATEPLDILNTVWACSHKRSENPSSPSRPELEKVIDSLNDGDKMIIKVGQDRLGISSMAFETGCIAVVLYNCYSPLILAPSAKVDGCFELVCSAFVDGIMHGEAMADYERQEPLQEFILV